VLPYLPDTDRHVILQRVLAAINNEDPASSWKAEASAAITPVLPEVDRHAIVAQALADSQHLAYASPRKTIFEAAIRFDPEAKRLTWHDWRFVLRAAGARGRHDLLSDLEVLHPAVHAVGGDAAVDETVCALRDVMRWWP
jgi:hypothetical protein